MAVFFIGKLTPIFEAEGYFVHQISRDQGLYQLRKDNSVIDLARSGTTLRFSCRQTDSALVGAGVYEALAALERSIREMREPLDSTSIRAGMQDVGPLGPGELRMADYLTVALVKAELTGTSKAAIIDELLDVLDRNHLLADRAEAHGAVWEREQSMSTGLQYGVAIPHGKTDAVDRLVCCIGIKRDGVDFDAMDGQPSRIFVLTLSPKSKPAPHLQFMSTISRTLNESGRRQVLAAGSAADIHQVFTRPAKTRTEDRRAAAPKRMTGGLAMDDYLGPQCVTPHLASRTTEGTIRELIGLLHGAGHVTDVEAAVRAVLDREAQLPTGMTDGIAIPHGRTEAVDHLACAVGIAAEGVDFGAVDGQPTRIVVLVLTTPAGAEPYLQFVASLLSVLTDEGRRRVLAAGTPEELLAALTGPST
jgi:mannitol/fructose-specific phosphotransferase system IIA component (Ntr-type)